MEDDDAEGVPDLPSEGPGSKIARGALEVVGGGIPFAGGLFAAIAGAWSEKAQHRINEFLHQWLRMQAAQVEEQQQTILEITSRIDMRDEETAERVESPEYQALLRKAFRDWSGAESEDKRKLIRNILTNAALTRVVSDDVVKLFLDWIRDYSEFHFEVIGAIYNDKGISRGGVWRKLGRQRVREDSSEADLFRLLFRDLSTGGIVRQHRETDYQGNFLTKGQPSSRRPPAGTPKGPKPMTSAFDDEDQYELTALGQQFVHYAMTDVPPKIDFSSSPAGEPSKQASQDGEENGR